MSWFIYAFLCSFSESLSDATGKRGVQVLGVRTTAWAKFVFAALVVWLGVLIFSPEAPALDRTFWVAMSAAAVMNAVAFLIYLRALRFDLSLVTPIVTLSPATLLITAPFINREFPTLLGAVGVIVLVIGTYLLTLERGKGLFAPFKNLWKNEGTRCMLFVLLIWSFTAPVDKIALQHSNAFWYIAIVDAAIALLLLPVVIHRGRIRKAFTLQGIRTLFPVGTITGIMQLFQMFALALVPVAYVIAIKRTSAIWSILWGKIFFKEKNIGQRFLAGLIMCAGAAIILFASTIN